MKTTTFADLTDAYILSLDHAAFVARELIADLRAMPQVGSVDCAGIAVRGGDCISRVIASKPRSPLQVACAYRVLRQVGAHYVLTDRLECAEVVRETKGGAA